MEVNRVYECLFVGFALSIYKLTIKIIVSFGRACWTLLSIREIKKNLMQKFG